MSKSDSPAQISAGTTQLEFDLPSDTIRLGIDHEGETHYYSRIANAVAVVDETEHITHRQELGERSLATWIAYVATERGWNELRYVDSFAELLSDTLEVA